MNIKKSYCDILKERMEWKRLAVKDYIIQDGEYYCFQGINQHRFWIKYQENVGFLQKKNKDEPGLLLNGFLYRYPPIERWKERIEKCFPDNWNIFQIDDILIIHLETRFYTGFQKRIRSREYLLYKDGIYGVLMYDDLYGYRLTSYYPVKKIIKNKEEKIPLSPRWRI